MPSAGPPTAPSLLLCEKKAVDRYIDDQQCEAKVRNHHIDLNAALGREQVGISDWSPTKREDAADGHLAGEGFRRVAHKRPGAW